MPERPVFGFGFSVGTKEPGSSTTYLHQSSDRHPPTTNHHQLTAIDPRKGNRGMDRLAASTNTYHTYSLEDALQGIAAAGFKSVELTSVPGWTEHVRRDA